MYFTPVTNVLLYIINAAMVLNTDTGGLYFLCIEQDHIT